MDNVIEQLETLRRDTQARADAIIAANGRMNLEAHSLMEISNMAACLIRDIRVHNRNYPGG